MFLRSVIGECADPPPKLRTFLRLMLEDEFAHLIDGVNAVQIAFALRRSPGEQAVAAENQAFSTGIVFHGSAQSAAPVQSRDAATEPTRFCDRTPC